MTSIIISFDKNKKLRAKIDRKSYIIRNDRNDIYYVIIDNKKTYLSKKVRVFLYGNNLIGGGLFFNNNDEKYKNEWNNLIIFISKGPDDELKPIYSIIYSAFKKLPFVLTYVNYMKYIQNKNPTHSGHINLSNNTSIVLKLFKSMLDIHENNDINSIHIFLILNMTSENKDILIELGVQEKDGFPIIPMFLFMFKNIWYLTVLKPLLTYLSIKNEIEKKIQIFDNKKKEINQQEYNSSKMEFGDYISNYLQRAVEIRSSFDINDLYQMNITVIKYLKVLHEQWVNDDSYPFSLFEANYLIDYYCSHIMQLGEKQDMFVENPSDDDIKNRTLYYVWRNGWKSYDIFKKQLSYKTGLILARSKIMEFKKDILQLISVDNSLKAFVVADGKDFNHIDLSKLTAPYVQYLIEFVISNLSTRYKYYASGYGMYRLINMHNLDIDSRNDLPCNCICISFISLMILYLLGYPKEKLFINPQKGYSNTSPQHLTHWAMSCENIHDQLLKPYLNVPEMVSKRQINIMTSEGFSLYTRNIIKFYINPKNDEKINLVLTNLKEDLFDKEFKTFGIKSFKGKYNS